MVIPRPKENWQASAEKPMFRTLTFVMPETLSQSELRLLAKLARITEAELSWNLMRRQLQAYRLGGWLVLLARVDNTLMVEAMVQQGPRGSYVRSLWRDLKRLAKDWDCSAMVTSTQDEKIVRLLELVGMQTKEWTMAAEIPDGQ